MTFIISILAASSFSTTKKLNETLLLVESSRANMLMLRRNEKDLMLRKQTKYVEKFNRNYAVLRKNLALSELEPQLKSSLT